MNKVPTEAGYYWARREGYGWIVVELTKSINNYIYVWATGCETVIDPEDLEWGEKITRSEPIESSIYDPEWCQNARQATDVYG